MSHLDALEAEAIHIMREVAAQFENPVMLYSVGKDSSVMVRIAQKAFFPGKIPFPLMHIDTGYKFQEMIEFRDKFCEEQGLDLIVEQNTEWVGKAHPDELGTDRCCHLLKTTGLLDALAKHGFDAAFGGARRDEEKSRAKERVLSFRDAEGQWDPKAQRPEIWTLYNTHKKSGETVRVFPISNWTEADVWEYIERENIPVVPLYFARSLPVVEQNGVLVPSPDGEERMCRFRSLGCSPCTGAVESDVVDLAGIREELAEAKFSERQNRVIDHNAEASMEQKKREGYF